MKRHVAVGLRGSAYLGSLWIVLIVVVTTAVALEALGVVGPVKNLPDPPGDPGTTRAGPALRAFGPGTLDPLGTGEHSAAMSASKSVKCELLVIGRGMAGMAAAFFAANRGLSVVQVGITGEIIFASGLLDLMGVHPLEEKRSWRDPWAGIDALVRDIPNHPYARLIKEEIRAAFGL